MPGKPVEAGRLRHVLEIQTCTEAANAAGELVPTWATAATRRAEIEPLAGRELWIAQQAQASVTHRVTLRYYAGLTPKMRFKWGSVYFQIESVLVAEQVFNRTECLCTEQI